MPEEFVKVCTTDQVPPGRKILVELSRFECILLVNLDGAYYALGEICPHSEAALSEGMLYGDEVECPLHGSAFRVKTGEVVSPPCQEDLIVYQVRVVGNDVLLGPEV